MDRVVVHHGVTVLEPVMHILRMVEVTEHLTEHMALIIIHLLQQNLVEII